MKRTFIFLVPAIVFGSCKGGENKADISIKEPEPQMEMDTAKAPVASPAKDTPVRSSGQTRSIEVTDPKSIVRSIDKHLVSSAQFKTVPGGGITDCLVTVTNTLPGATFQKALVEVTIKKEDNTVLKTDYYTVVNIEPGMSKIIKVPNHSLGSSVYTAIIKIKSAELTNGEFVLAGVQQ